jgi:hypothetical protein
MEIASFTSLVFLVNFLVILLLFIMDMLNVLLKIVHVQTLLNLDRLRDFIAPFAG